MTRNRLAGFVLAGAVALLLFGGLPGGAARSDGLRPLLDDLQSFDTLYLSASDGDGNDYWIYASGDGRVTVDMDPGNIRYYYDGEVVHEDSAWIRWYGRRNLAMPDPAIVVGPLRFVLDQASSRFSAYRFVEEPLPGMPSTLDVKDWHFIPSSPLHPDVYLGIRDGSRAPIAVSLLHDAFALRDENASREFYFFVNDLAFNVPVPVGTFQANWQGEPCEVPEFAAPGQCVPPHSELSATRCNADVPYFNMDQHEPCEFVHPPSHPASEFAAGGDCHKGDDDHDDDECGHHHDGHDDDPGDEDEHEHDGHGDDGDDHGGGHDDHGDGPGEDHGDDDHGSGHDDHGTGNDDRGGSRGGRGNDGRGSRGGR